MLNIARISYLCFILLVAGCGQNAPEAERQVLASVGAKYLYADELTDMVPSGLSKEDSLAFVKNYAQNWVEEQLFISEAKKDKDINMKEIDAMVEEYRNTLLYYAHLNNVVSSSMDTIVTEAQLHDFYGNNNESFELQDHILKANIVIAPAGAKKADRAKKEFFAKSEPDQALLEEFCREAAYRCQLEDSSWISFDEFVKIVPVDRTQSPEFFLKNNRTFELRDTALVYWVKIEDYKIKESTSPFEFVRNEIRLILLNRRKNDFLASYRKKLFDEAVANNNVELKIP